MTVVDATGFAATLLNVVGNMLLAYRLRSGWSVRIDKGIGAHMRSRLFLIINFVGLRKWSGES